MSEKEFFSAVEITRPSEGDPQNHNYLLEKEKLKRVPHTPLETRRADFKNSQRRVKLDGQRFKTGK